MSDENQTTVQKYESDIYYAAYDTFIDISEKLVPMVGLYDNLHVFPVAQAAAGVVDFTDTAFGILNDPTASEAEQNHKLANLLGNTLIGTFPIVGPVAGVSLYILLDQKIDEKYEPLVARDLTVLDNGEIVFKYYNSKGESNVKVGGGLFSFNPDNEIPETLYSEFAETFKDYPTHIPQEVVKKVYSYHFIEKDNSWIVSFQDEKGNPLFTDVSIEGKQLITFESGYVIGLGGPTGPVTGYITDLNIEGHPLNDIQNQILTRAELGITDTFTEEFQILDLVPTLALDPETGYQVWESRYGTTYKKDGFTYAVNDDGFFTVNYGHTLAKYSGGDQLLIHDNPETGTYFMVEKRLDGKYGFLSNKMPENSDNDYIIFDNYAALPIEIQIHLSESLLLIANSKTGEHFSELLKTYTHLQQGGLLGFLYEITDSGDLIFKPEIKGYNPDSVDDGSPAQNGETFNSDEEESLNLFGTEYNIQIRGSSGADFLALTNDELVKMVGGEFLSYQQTNNNDARFQAMGQLLSRWDANPLSLIADGYQFVEHSNGGGQSKILISADGSHSYGSITAVQKGNFNISVVEAIGTGADVKDVVQIITQDIFSNTGSRSEPIELVYPEHFYFQDAGSRFGGLLADKLADDNVFKNIIYNSLFQTAGQALGTYTDLVVAGTLEKAALYGATKGADTGIREDLPSLSESFASNLASSISSYLGGLVVAEASDIIDIGGFGGELFNVTANAIVTPIINDGLTTAFNLVGLSTGEAQPTIFDSDFSFKDFGAQVLTAIGSYVGSRLAGEFVEAETKESATFSTVYSTVNNILAAPAIIASGPFAPITAALVAFQSKIFGSFLGNLFWGYDAPIAETRIRYDYQNDEYYRGVATEDDGGDINITNNMANAVINGANTIIELTGGVLRHGSGVPVVNIGYDEHGTFVRINGNQKHFERSGDAIDYAALHMLKGYDLVGGHTVVMRAWHNSKATTIQEFQTDIFVAESYIAYLMNPASVIALMLNEPDSEAALQWAAVLTRAEQLGLHLPSEHDFDGGWAQILEMYDNINPEAIPDIDGNSIVLTDPITGQETRLEQILGPGYEIVRMEGTDGKDVYNIVVDTESISYVNAGPGDDSFVGHNGVDIFIGGDGDDTAYGGDGNDWLVGGDGDDTLFGEAGDDFIVGGAGNDSISGGDGVDTIHGGEGDDIIDGNGDLDYVHGGSGNDILYSDAGNNEDKIYGQEGDDILITKGSGSKLTGGVGNDTYQMNVGENTIIINRSEGHDTVELSETVGQTTLYFSTNVDVNELWFQQQDNDLKILVLGENQSVTVKDWFVDSHVKDQLVVQSIRGYLEVKGDRIQELVDAYARLEQPQGDYNLIDDTVLVNQTEVALNQRYYDEIWQVTNDYLKADGADGGGSSFVFDPYDSPNAGNYDGKNTWRTVTDEAGTLIWEYGEEYWDVRAQYGDVEIIAGFGENDVFYHARGVDYFLGGAGDDYLHTGNTITNGGGGSRLYGGSGDDLLTGYLMNDVLIGGLGNDTIMLKQSFYRDGEFRGHDVAYGGAGDDYIDAGKGRNIVYGGIGNDTIVSEGSFKNIFYAGLGDDVINVTYGTNRLYGEEGNDTINGGTREDFIYGGSGNDIINSGEGDDYISGGEGDDILDAAAGNDIIAGDAGDDILDYRAAENAESENVYNGGEGNDALRIYLTAAEYALPRMQADLLRYKNAIAQAQATGTINALVWRFALFDLIATEIETLEVYVDGELQDLSYTSVEGTDISNTLIGTAGNDLINGHDGNDIVNGGAGDDEIYGGAGRDVITDGEGWNHIDAGDGNDAVKSGSGNDEVQAGAGDDFVFSGSGDDTVFGGSGKDILLLGEGNDIVFGGSGNDRITGEAGDDIIDGEGGNDTAVYSGLYADYTIEELEDTFKVTATDSDEGADTLKNIERIIFADGVYDAETKTFTVGFATDDNTGTYSGDTLTGTTSDDVFYGLGGNDTVYGYAGDDYIEGGSGNDVLQGGEGADVLNGGEGVDRVLYSTAASGVVANLSNASLNTGDAAGDTYVSIEDLYGSKHDDVLTGDDLGNRIWGYFGADRIYGGGGKDYLYGYDGDDEIHGGLGDDYLYGQDGDDTLYGDDGADYLNGHAGNDTLRGGAGDDTLYGDDGDDTLYGDDGADYLNGHAGNDTLRGGAGGDTLYGDDGDDTLYGDTGDDVLYGGAGDDTLYGQDGNDLIYGNEGSDRVYGHDGDDKLYGLDGDDLIYGGAGNDLMYGHDGDDKLYGHDGNDYLYGHAGDDELYGQDGNDYLNGYEGDDILNGGAGNDRLYGGIGDDRLYGLDGDDYLNGQDGDDYLNGYEGNDRLYGLDGADYLNGGEGHDYVNGGSGNDRVYGGSGNDRVYGLDGDDLVVGQEGYDRVYGGSGNDILYGGADDDKLYGQDGNDVMYGEDGIDFMYGHTGDDYVSGGSGDDTLFGNEGNDVLVGGSGYNRLLGGTGSDTFVLDTASLGDGKYDQILDFSLTEGDRIDVSDVLEGYNPDTDSITDFVNLYSNSNHSYLQIDASGQGNFGGAADLLIRNITDLPDINTMIDNGNLVV